MDAASLSFTQSPAIEASPARIAALSHAPASAKMVMLALAQIKGGAIELTLPDKSRLLLGDGDGPRALMKINAYAFAKRVLRRGDIGFAEGLMAGEWESEDLSTLLTLLARNVERIKSLVSGGLMGRACNFVRQLGRANTRAGARRNILAHYDLGNQFYRAWLDPTMTYSSARFDAHTRDLEAGQRAKYQALARHLDLKPGEHVLEIGCGWGGFAEYAAREVGARVTGLTISDAQLVYAQERIQRADLTGLVDIRRQDYRDVDGAFDKVASIEMFEAVGEKYWPVYFRKIADVLKPGGKAALQIITIREDLFEDYRSRADFIQRYVFPGGMLASVARLQEEVANVGLAWKQAEAFGENYAETLAQWGKRFLANWDQIQGLGFDDRFKQLWRFYLSYCEAGFRTGRTDVVQLQLAKT
jgi:cyclopropane-fatty-acyl-phospholipid synthase